MLAAIACIAVLVRHVWQLDGVAQELALGLTGVATITWSAAALAFTSVSAQKSSSPTEPAVLYLMTTGTLILCAVAFVLAFI